jgi:secreted trypsin-like serine protease
MLKLLIVLLALSTLTLAVEKNKNTPKIYGSGTSEKRVYDGTPAVSGQFKFMVGIFVQEPSAGFLCGGFILNKYYVGTAAHCVDQYKNTSLIIYTVEDDLNLNELPVPGSVIKAHVQAIHPFWNGANLGGGYDIALLRTLSPIPLGGNIEPIELATEVPKEGDTLYLAGYGQQPDDSTGLLLWVDQPYVTPSQCDEAWNSTFNSDLLICAGGEPGRGSCHGDSGSALFTTSDINNPTDAKAVGIVSFGSAEGCGTLPVVYTNIPNFGSAWFNYAIATASYCPRDCIRTFRRCVGPLRTCRKAKQACIAKCIFA